MSKKEVAEKASAPEAPQQTSPLADGEMGMAWENDVKELPPQSAPETLSEADLFRRQAAMSILGAYVTRQGGFTAEEREAHMRQVWMYADAFVRLEHALPLPPPVVPEQPQRPKRSLRPASPSDEWAVIYDGVRRRGFVSKEEAEYYAGNRVGAEVVQLSGPDIITAPSSVPASV